MTAPIRKPSPAMVGFSAFLKQKRRDQNLTVQEVAYAARISESVLRRIESGGGCHIDTLDRIAKAVNCSLAVHYHPPSGRAG